MKVLALLMMGAAVFPLGSLKARDSVRWSEGSISEGALESMAGADGAIRWRGRDWKDPWEFWLGPARAVHLGGTAPSNVAEAAGLAELADGGWVSLKSWRKDGGDWILTPLLGEEVRLPEAELAALTVSADKRAWKVAGFGEFEPWTGVEGERAEFRRSAEGGIQLGEAKRQRSLPEASMFLQLHLTMEGAGVVDSLLIGLLNGKDPQAPVKPGSALVEVSGRRIAMQMLPATGRGRDQSLSLPDTEENEGNFIRGPFEPPGVVKQRWALYFDQLGGKIQAGLDGVKVGEWQFEPVPGAERWRTLILWGKLNAYQGDLRVSGFSAGVWDGSDPWSVPEGRAVLLADKGWLKGASVEKWDADKVAVKNADGSVRETTAANVRRVITGAEIKKPQGGNEVRLEGLASLHGQRPAVENGVFSTHASGVTWKFPSASALTVEAAPEQKAPSLTWVELSKGGLVPGRPKGVDKNGVTWVSAPDAPGQRLPWAGFTSVRRFLPTPQKGTQLILKNGDVVAGTLISMDQTEARINVAGEAWKVARADVARCVPDSGGLPRRVDAFSDPEQWIREGESAAQALNVRNGLTAAPGHPEWLRFRDGVFELRPDGLAGRGAVGDRARLSREIAPSAEVDVSFRLRDLADNVAPSEFSVVFIGQGDDPNFLCNYAPYAVSVFVQEPVEPGKKPKGNPENEALRAQIPVAGHDPLGMREPGGQKRFDIHFSRSSGVLTLMRDGHKVADFKNDKLKSLKAVRRVVLTILVGSRQARLIQDLVVQPGSPTMVTPGPLSSVELGFPNGDGLPAYGLEFADGSWGVESQIGGIKLPLSRVGIISVPGAIPVTDASQGVLVTDVNGTRIQLRNLTMQDGVLQGTDARGETRRLNWDEVSGLGPYHSY